MRKSISEISGLESFLAGVFIVCAFYGDVHLRFVFPLSMAVLPLMLAFALAKRRTASDGFNAGVALLLGLLSAVALQFLTGTPAPTRADLSLYGPVVYAIATAFTFSLVRISDAAIWRSLMLGGLVTAVVIVATIALVPDGEFIVPGQNATETEHEFKQSRSPGRDVTKYQSNAVSVPGNTDDKSVRSFYHLKNKVRNALGRSNYLAVFFVFLFSVSLFRRSWIFASLFGLLTVATLSRFGMLWLVIAFLIWLAHSSRIPAKKIIGAALALLASAALAVAVWPEHLANLPGIQSIDARLSFWQSGFHVVADHLFFGVPRSAILDQYGYLITWNPHNSLLWVASMFGMFGLAFYLAYIFIVMRGIYQRAKESRLWHGIFVGFAIAFVWSFVEIIVLTPAFEIMLALAYGLSRTNPATPQTAINAAA